MTSTLTLSTPLENTAPASRENLRNWIAVLGALLGAFMAVLDIQISNSSLQNITGGIGATLDEGSWVSLSYLVPEIIVIPLCGWLAQVFGMRRYLIWNSTLFLIFSMGCGFAWDLPSMIFFRALQGFTGGALIPMASTLILLKLPANKQAIGFALFGLSAMFAPAIGPTIGGWITENYSWPWIFYINLVPGILLISAIAYGLDATPMRLPMLKKGDWTGILFMALGLGSLTVFLEEGTRNDWFGSVYITRLAVITAIALPVFVMIQLMRKKITPIVNLRLFARRNFLLGSMVNLVLGLCLYGFMYLLPVYLVQIQGYNAMQIGSTMMWVGLPQLVVMPFMPVLMKWIDKRVIVAFGLGMFGLSAMMMSGMTAETAHDQLVLPQIIRAVGLTCTIVPLSLITTGGIEAQNAASASGLFNMLRNLGGSMGIALLSALLTQREHFHSHHLGEAVSLYNPLTRDRLAAIAQNLISQGIDAVGAQDRAIQLLDATVRKQAYIMAYNNCFQVAGLLLFAMIPLIFLCTKTAGSSAAGTH
ncbi:MAG: DHA2 family efflux MFS transporter permease subunit [Verrucomicrobia bacterium]|nr:DHA2 family efflux MFS transporter permease subunit [Verrucomicrobiota bacterium]